MLLIHDLPEALSGDQAAFQVRNPKEKYIQEKKALEKIITMIPWALWEEISHLWEEFEASETPEALFCKTIDKLEATIQHCEADISTWSEEEYEFAFTSGKKYTDHHEIFQKLRARVDSWSEEKIQQVS